MSQHHEVLRAVLPDVSRETLARLDLFADEFRRWSTRINLVAGSTTEDLWTRHIADSAQLLRLAPNAKHWADLGSGGGFPGMVIAVLLAQDGDARVDLIESNRKKTAFLHAAKATCSVPAHIHARRIEDVVPDLPCPEVVTARALASLDALLSMTHTWLSRGAVGLFHKGRGYAAEVEESRDRWQFDLIQHPSLIAPDAAILEIRNLRAAG